MAKHFKMIEVNNLTTKKIEPGFLEKIAEQILTLENKEKDKELSIVLVGSARMRKLNKKHRAKNRVTDVLSFNAEKNSPALGEIVICLREVNKNAKRTNSSFEKELTNCLIHGLLHLLGYNHEKEETGAKRMFEKQKEYLLKALNNVKETSTSRP